MLDEEGWGHVVARHPEMAPYPAVVMATVASPDHREEDPRPPRERFWRHGMGPARWMFVVVDFADEPARVLTAYGRAEDPAGW